MRPDLSQIGLRDGDLMTTAWRVPTGQQLLSDYGCDVNPVLLGCLSCPLDVCVLERPINPQYVAARARQAERRPRIKALLDDGVRPTEIAQRLGLSLRMVFRELKVLRT